VKYSHVDINNNMNLQYPSQVCFGRSSRNTIPRAMVFHVFEHNYIIYEYIHNYFYTIVPLITTSMAQGFLDSCTNVPILSNIENVIAIYYNSIVYIYGYGSKKLYIYINVPHYTT